MFIRTTGQLIVKPNKVNCKLSTCYCVFIVNFNNSAANSTNMISNKWMEYRENIGKVVQSSKLMTGSPSVFRSFNEDGGMCRRCRSKGCCLDDLLPNQK